MRLYLVRHAHAGNRSSWTGDDRLRPLSPKGVRQAEAICKELAALDVRRLVSSPSLRCVETLQPLAQSAGLPLDTDVRLGEGSDLDASSTMFEELLAEGVTAAASTHGDVIADFLTTLHARGTQFEHAPTWPKASMWVVEGEGRAWARAQYVPPPVVADA